MLRKLCWPVLRFFEKGEGSFHYKPLNRKILIAVGLLFFFLTVLIGMGLVTGGALGYLIPFLVFGSVSLVCLIVGALGSDRAVANIWGNR